MNVVEIAYSKNRAFHSAEFRSLGPTTEVLWKGGANSQCDRFEQVVRLLPDLTGKSVLDVGCGFGDFYSYLQHLGCKDLEYCGIDICGELIDECRRRHPDNEFYECGILEFEATKPRFDFVIASGVFAMPMPDWQTYVVATIESMFRVARLGIAANFLSNYSRAPNYASHYANPGQTLELLMRHVSPWAVLAHDYRWNDFTIGLFHQPRTLDCQHQLLRGNHES